MKKKILIGVLVVIIIAVVAICYFVFNDGKQEQKLKDELLEISNLTNVTPIDVDAINKKLEETITTGDYATVEKAMKSYLKDSFDNMIRIAELLNDDRITGILTAENYQEDGPDFVETKAYITSTIQELETRKNSYQEYLTEEKAMSYIENKGLDDYYIDFYKTEIVKDMESDDTTVADSIDGVIEILRNSEKVIDFLITNKDNWKIENDSVVFSNEDLSNQYINLISQI